MASAAKLAEEYANNPANLPIKGCNASTNGTGRCEFRGSEEEFAIMRENWVNACASHAGRGFFRSDNIAQNECNVWFNKLTGETYAGFIEKRKEDEEKNAKSYEIIILLALGAIGIMLIVKGLK